ncbi:hypothetical protein ROHU_032118 [Labeo rohita]|uniref:Uncharacterized protein n=1 Tax=Labeo rohita TaxID=84645 RepID=A0A498LLB5_LABRO|nr:hypothetical protein ROHU_032118 [Labeo rohita]
MPDNNTLWNTENLNRTEWTTNDGDLESIGDIPASYCRKLYTAPTINSGTKRSTSDQARCKKDCTTVHMPDNEGTGIVEEWYWLCGHVVYTSLPRSWTGTCAIVQLYGATVAVRLPEQLHDNKPEHRLTKTFHFSTNLKSTGLLMLLLNGNTVAASCSAAAFKNGNVVAASCSAAAFKTGNVVDASCSAVAFKNGNAVAASCSAAAFKNGNTVAASCSAVAFKNGNVVDASCSAVAFKNGNAVAASCSAVAFKNGNAVDASCSAVAFKNGNVVDASCSAVATGGPFPDTCPTATCQKQA